MSARVVISAILTIALVTLSSPTSAYWQGNTLPVEGHPGCPGKLLVSQGLIIDIVASRKNNGVRLLEGSRESSFSTCVTKCCQRDGCDLALYKKEGVSPTGRNCYYIECGKPENCHMVADDGFMSATIVGDDASVGTGREGGQKGDKVELQHTPVPSPTAPSHTHSVSGNTEPQLSTGPQATEEPSSPDSTGQPSEPPASHVPLLVHSPTQDTAVTETPTLPDLVPTEEEEEKTESTKEDPENQKPTEDVSGPTDSGQSGGVVNTTLPQGDESGQGEVNDTDFLGKQDEHIRPVIKTHETGHGRKKSCDEDGCDGKGVIIVAVVSSVALLITIVLSIILFRYMANRRRKKRFRNVDYLINGMYT